MSEAKSPRSPSGEDPRLRLDREALDAASLTAMPQVGRASGTGDALVLLAGAAGIALLGGLTFFSLGRHPKPVAAVSPPSVTQAAPPSADLPPIDPSLNPPVSPPVEPSPAEPILSQPQPPPAQAPAHASRPATSGTQRRAPRP